MSLSVKAGRARSQGGMAGRVRQGDPGLLGALGGAVGGFLTGGPLGAIGGAIAGYSGGPKISQPTGTSVGAIPTPGIGGTVARLVPGGSTGYSIPGAAGGSGSVAAAPSGYRLNKSGYFLKDGSYVPPRSKYVKIRRRNSMNPRALSRAISRVNGGKRLQHTLSQISTGKYTASGKKK